MDDRDAELPAARRKLLMGGAALAAALPFGALGIPSAAFAQVGAQTDWRYCAKCAAMFWDGAPNKGRCPAGGGHAAQGFVFNVHYDSGRGGANQSQYDWRFCSKCMAMYWDGSANKGHCPAGGPHTAQGFNFGLNFGNPGGAAQNDWRFCQKCNELFWNDSPSHGACAGGAGGHVAQGFTFTIPFSTQPGDPGKLISEAVAVALPQALPLVQGWLLQFLGTPNLLGKGYSLHKMNLRLAQPNVTYNAGSFAITMSDNYLYTQVTQPSFLGSEADPAFEIHADWNLHGSVQRLSTGKLQAQNLVAQVTHILVKPRDVTGGIVTTVVAAFQLTGAGGRMIQRAMDNLKVDLTSRINNYLQTFS